MFNLLEFLVFVAVECFRQTVLDLDSIVAEEYDLPGRGDGHSTELDSTKPVFRPFLGVDTCLASENARSRIA